MTISENIELPKLTAKEAWLEDIELSNEIKRLLYLPHIAYKTAIYNNNNELSKYQKDRLILLFRDESEKAFQVVHNQIFMIVGNEPAERLEYFKDFESWKERLVEFVKKSMDCITKEQWIKEFTTTFPSKKQLANEGKLTKEGKFTIEGKKLFEEHLKYYTKRGEGKVFDERIYWNKCSEFIIEAYNLLRRFSVMHSITMENIDRTIKGLENIGKLPENIKVALKKKLKEPSKKDCQIYLYVNTIGESQTEAAKKFFPKLKPSTGQSKISRIMTKVRKWLDACGLPTEQVLGRIREITVDPAKIELGERTDGKRHGDPVTNRLHL